MLALHFAPHPDGELIGAPATLMALRGAGWRIANLTCSLGRPEQERWREMELREACGRARFDLLLPAGPVDISAGRDPDAARAERVAQRRSGCQLGIAVRSGERLGPCCPGNT